MEDHCMKHLRWSAVPAVLALVLVACNGGGGTQSPGASTAGTAGEDPTAVCDADEFGCVEIAAGDPIRLASALSITGDTAFLGNDSNFGTEVAIDDRGEVFGRSVELVKEDAGCAEAEDGQTAAQAIVADPTIVGVIGTTCSRTAVPAMPVLAEAGLVMISPSNTAPSLTDPESADFGGPFYFRTAYNDEVQGAAVAQFVCDEHPDLTTAATIHDGSPYAEQLQEVFVEQFAEICGGTVTTQEAINVGDQDFSTVLTTIGADSPDILFFPIFSPEGPLVFRQAQDVAGLADTTFIGADGLKDGAFIEAAGDLAEEVGMFFSGPDLNLGPVYEDDFLPKYLEKSGTETPLAPYHAHGYDAANIFFDAIEAVGVEDADGTLFIPRDAVRQFVADLTDFPGLTGTLSCDEFGDCGSEFVSIATLEGGAFNEVYTTRQ
jgi:branched-chain amino acid transport system substrate-binding protein